MIDFPTLLAQAGYYSYGNDFHYGAPGMYSGATFIGLILVLGAAMIGGLVQMGLKNAFKQYSEEPAPLTGAETARRMLRQNGLDDVQVISVQGQLTDHYNPLDR